MKSFFRIPMMVATLTGLAVTTAAQNGQTEAVKQQPVKADSVTINMPEGMTREQADEILTELKAIHQLLEHPPAAAVAAQPAANPTPSKVTMGVASGWYSIGRDDAPVTVVEFADYQCPFCRRFHSDAFAELKKDFIDTGKVRFVSRDLPLDFHPNAPGGAAAARCAGDQGKFWEMRDLLLASDADLSQASLVQDARQIHIDASTFSTCLGDKKYAAAIQKDVADAGSLGISGTPSFVVAKTAKDQMNGVLIVGAVPFSVFDNAIRDQLNPAP
jgi:protein-disulfide isomerase